MTKKFSLIRQEGTKIWNKYLGKSDLCNSVKYILEKGGWGQGIHKKSV